MSRSYKRNPIIKDNGKSKKKDKCIANSSVRSYLSNADDETSLQNSDYKKVYESYNISDFISRFTERDAYEWYVNNADEYVMRKYPTLDSWMNHWKKERLVK